MMLGQQDSHMPKNEVGPLPHTTHKNSKQITDPNVRTKTTKFLEEKIEINICAYGLDNIF